MYIRRNGKCFWGSNCRCHTISILATEQELVDSIETGKPIKSKNEVHSVPKNFNRWVEENKDRIEKAKSKPLWMKDNKSYLEKEEIKEVKSLTFEEMKKLYPELDKFIFNSVKKSDDNFIKNVTNNFPKDEAIAKIQQFIDVSKMSGKALYDKVHIAYLENELEVLKAKSVAQIMQEKAKKEMMEQLAEEAHGAGKKYSEYLKKLAENKKEADEYFRPVVSDIWKSLDEEAREVLHGYTDTNYGYINKSLYKNNVQTYEGRILEKVISKSKYDKTVYLVRGTDIEEIEGIFGEKIDSFNYEKINSLVGKKGVQKSFISTGAAKGTGFTNKQVQMIIEAPKGTEMIYAEPFSEFSGERFGKDWDGIQKQKVFGEEFEMIVNCGYEMIVEGSSYDESKNVVKLVVKLLKRKITHK